jgi:hypothetical protein
VIEGIPDDGSSTGSCRLRFFFFWRLDGDREDVWPFVRRQTNPFWSVPPQMVVLEVWRLDTACGDVSGILIRGDVAESSM